MAPVLGLTQAEELNIITFAPYSLPAQRIAMLRMWRQRQGPEATFSRLSDAFRRCGRLDLVERVSQLAERRASLIGEPLNLVYVQYVS